MPVKRCKAPDAGCYVESRGPDGTAAWGTAAVIIKASERRADLACPWSGGGDSDAFRRSDGRPDRSGNRPALWQRDYQLAFFMPGILPSWASWRSMMREMPNLR